MPVALEQHNTLEYWAVWHTQYFTTFPATMSFLFFIHSLATLFCLSPHLHNAHASLPRLFVGCTHRGGTFASIASLDPKTLKNVCLLSPSFSPDGLKINPVWSQSFSFPLKLFSYIIKPPVFPCGKRKRPLVAPVSAKMLFTNASESLLLSPLSPFLAQWMVTAALHGEMPIASLTSRFDTPLLCWNIRAG